MFKINYLITSYSYLQLVGNNQTVLKLYLGVSLVIALLLRRTTAWKNCKFRIFGVTTKIECIFEEKQK